MLKRAAITLLMFAGPLFAQTNFSTLTSGTNTNATMTVGSGASISTTGSGTISANQLGNAPVYSNSSRNVGLGLSFVWGGGIPNGATSG